MNGRTMSRAELLLANQGAGLRISNLIYACLELPAEVLAREVQRLEPAGPEQPMKGCDEP